MEFFQNECYKALVQELRVKYQIREEEIFQLLERQDRAGIWKRAERIRSALEAHLLDPDLEGTPLKVRSVEQLCFSGYTVEKLAVSSAGELSIPANLYLPHRPGPHPAVVAAMGHWLQGKAMADNQRFCANLALRGIATITFDPIFQGERCPYDEKGLTGLFGDVPEDMWMVAMHMQPGNLAYLLEKNVAALFTFEAKRMVDCLLSREDIDPNRIAVSGQSGGGTQACYLSALDSRVKALIPVQCLSRLAITLENGIGDCEQSFLGISAQEGVEQGDLLWASLGKPIMHSAGRFDYFSVDGVYSIAREMTAVYEVIGCPGGYEMKLADCGHELTQQTREQIYQWICRQFGLTIIPREIDVKPLPPEALRCLSPSENAVTPIDVYRQLLHKAAARRSHDPGTIRRQLRERICPEPESFTVEDGEPQREVYTIHTASNQSALCRLKPGNRPALILVVGSEPPCLDTDAWVLHVTPWGIESACQKQVPCYDIETCLFNTAGVSGQNLCVQRVNQLLAALDEALERSGAKQITALGVEAGCLPVLLAAWVSKRPIRTILKGCPCGFDELFDKTGFFLRETDIVPGLLEIADIPELCALADVEVLSIRTPDGKVKEYNNQKNIHVLHNKG